MASSFLIGMLIGFVLAIAITIFCLWEKMMDRGGCLLMDEENGIYQIFMNSDFEDWASQKFIIIKVNTEQKKLKHVPGPDDRALEGLNEIE